MAFVDDVRRLRTIRMNNAGGDVRWWWCLMMIYHHDGFAWWWWLIVTLCNLKIMRDDDLFDAANLWCLCWCTLMVTYDDDVSCWGLWCMRMKYGDDVRCRRMMDGVWWGIMELFTLMLVVHVGRWWSVVMVTLCDGDNGVYGDDVWWWWWWRCAMRKHTPVVVMLDDVWWWRCGLWWCTTATRDGVGQWCTAARLVMYDRAIW